MLDHTSKIHEQMDVICSCGTKLGKVDHVESDMIKLTKNDSADGRHHYIPTEWVDRVDGRVFINRNSQDAMEQWDPQMAVA